MTEFTPYYAEGFAYHDLDAIQEKVGAIALAGPSLLEVRLDFDRTMTTNGPKDVTSWDVLSNLLPEDARQEDDRLYNEYAPLERDHTLTRLQAEAWWNGTLGLYVANGVNVNDITKTATGISLRPGVTELFASAQEHNVHTTILSAGVKPVIEKVSEMYGINPDLVLSTELVTLGDGTIIGWDQDSLIHILNKGEMSSPILRSIRESRPNVIVVGDALEDTSMAEDHDEGQAGEVIRIRVGDPHKIRPGEYDEFISESFLAGYDLVSLGNFEPINGLARFITQHPRQVA